MLTVGSSTDGVACSDVVVRAATSYVQEAASVAAMAATASAAASMIASDSQPSATTPRTKKTGTTNATASNTKLRTFLQSEKSSYSVRDVVLALSGGAIKSIPSFSLETQQKRRRHFLPKFRNADSDEETSKRALTETKTSVEINSSPKETTVVQAQRQIDVEKREARTLNMIRVLFLCYYASLGSLLPYLPVYYDSIGHGGQVIGLLGAVKPATTFVVAPLWGMISDQSKRPFQILVITFWISLLGQLFVALKHDAFYIMSMVFVTAVFNAPVKSLLDALVMDQLKEIKSENAQYGRLRLWGQLGFGIGSTGAGYLLSRSKQIPWPETTSYSAAFEETMSRYFPAVFQRVLEYADKSWRSLTGYKLLFVLHGLLSLPTWWCITRFWDDQRRREKRNAPLYEKGASASTTSKNGARQKKGAGVVEGFKLLLQNRDAMLFFFLVFVVGLSSGMIENFAYVRMREVGGTGKEMGISRLVSSFAGAPMFWYAGPLANSLGADNVILLALISYAARFLIYAFERSPYHGLPAEALRGVTFAAFWSTCTSYAHGVSPPGLHATMLILLNAMYGGLGQSLGAVVGGRLQHELGTVKSFILGAGFDLAMVGLLVSYMWFQRVSNPNAPNSFRDPKPIVGKEQRKAD